MVGDKADAVEYMVDTFKPTQQEMEAVLTKLPPATASSTAAARALSSKVKEVADAQAAAKALQATKAAFVDACGNGRLAAVQAATVCQLCTVNLCSCDGSVCLGHGMDGVFRTVIWHAIDVD